MDQTALVKSDRDIGAQVIEALGQRMIPVSVWDWVYVPQLEEWQLVIASPWVDQKGIGTSYRALISALQKAKIYPQVPIRRVYLRSPKDPQVKELEHKIRERNEGFLHIIKHARSNGTEYSLMFAPATKHGVAPMKSFSDLASIKEFLSAELKIGTNRVEDALIEARTTGAGSIYPVLLTAYQIKKLANGTKLNRSRVQ